MVEKVSPFPNKYGLDRVGTKVGTKVGKKTASAALDRLGPEEAQLAARRVIPKPVFSFSRQRAIARLRSSLCLRWQ